MRNRKILIPALISILCILLLFLYYENNRIRSSGDVRLMLGTVVEITVLGKDEDVLERAVDAAFDRMGEIEMVADRYTGESEISRMNRTAADGQVDVSDEMIEMLRVSETLAAETEGAFDVTIAPLSDLWGFTGEPRLPAPEEIEALLSVVCHDCVVVDYDKKTVYYSNPDVAVDLGGIAKGYAVDEAVKVLESLDVVSGVINAGGDMAVIGKKGDDPWRIGIQHPRDSQELIAVLDIVDRSVVTSGDYERFFFSDDVRYHHIIDPHTGYPARMTMSITVVAENTAVADALATAYFVMGPKKALDAAEHTDGVDVLIVDADGNMTHSDGLSSILTLMR
ncbi:MAG: FAD:protein FMN transferase [Deltaproteobacteria bacterium]|nr:FAD:protein FMN transferase [Candidatus Zymogenaceae bacterium]